MIDLEVYIGNSKLDLFDDENVTLKRSVKNYREIDKLFSDYSQTFSIPASKNNNVIMEHWYDSDVQQTFNPSSKKSARLEINKHLFKKGFIKYESSQIKDGEIDSYSITFFTALVNLKQIFADDVLTDLPSTNVIPYNTYASALENRIQSNEVLLPMISPVRNWTLNALPDTGTINYNGFAGADNENKYLRFTFTEPSDSLDLLNNALIYKSTDSAPNGTYITIGSNVTVNDPTTTWTLNIYDKADNYSLEYTTGSITGSATLQYNILKPASGQKELVFEFIYSPICEFTITNSTIINNAVVIWLYQYSINGALLYEFKPALALTKIVDNIESKYGLTFSSDFLGTSAFTDLFIWTNKEIGVGNHFVSDWSLIDSPDQTIDPNNIWRNPSSRLRVTPSDGDVINQIEFKIGADISRIGAEELLRPLITLLVEEDLNGVVTYTEYELEEDGVFDRIVLNFTRPTTGVQYIKFYVKSSFPEVYEWLITSTSTYLDFTLAGLDREFDNDQSCKFHFFNSTYIDDVTGLTKNVNGGLPAMKVYDFFSSIIKMFNLVIVPDDNDNNIFEVLTLEDWYSNGDTVDLTKYADQSEEEVMTISLFNEINFKYEPTTQLIGKEFSDNNTGVGYGDLKTSLIDSFGDPLGSDTFEVKVPFVNPSWNRLTNTASTSSIAPFLSELLVCLMVDSELKPINDKPFIFYYAGQKDISANTAYSVRKFYSTPPTLSDKYEVYNLCYQFNTDDDSFTNSLCFGSQINPLTLNDGSASSPSIYNTYWEDYITDIYNNRMRRTIVKTILPLGVILTLKVNDTIVIKTKSYRINDMSMNMITGETKFELLTLIE